MGRRTIINGIFRIAAKNKNKEGLIDEIADLTYHISVLMFMQEVTPQDIRTKLAKRHNIKGNLKKQNKKGDF